MLANNFNKIKMAIINVNGFDFFTDINGNPMSLIIRGNNLSEEISFIKDNKIQSLSLNFFQSKNVLD